MVPPSDSAPRNSSSLLRSDRRWPSARITVAVIGLEFGDMAQPAQGSDRHRRSIQPLAQARDVELDRVRARFVVEPEKLLGEIRLAQHPAEAAEENFQQRSEEQKSENTSIMRISYAVFCLKKKTKDKYNITDKKAHSYQKEQ